MDAFNYFSFTVSPKIDGVKYVNSKQYMAILRLRLKKITGKISYKADRKRYLTRSLHACLRNRSSDGKFKGKCDE